MTKMVGKAFRKEGTEFFSFVLTEEEDGYVLFTFGRLGEDRMFRPNEKISRVAFEASLPYWEEISVGRFRAIYAEAIDFLRSFQK